MDLQKIGVGSRNLDL